MHFDFRKLAIGASNRLRFKQICSASASADPEGGGDRGSGPPPGKSQVKWVSIGNKQLDPPPLEDVGLPLES